MAKTTEVKVCGPNGNWNGPSFRVHAATCSAATRDLRSGGGWTMDASNQREIVVTIWQDIIDEGGMTENDAWHETHICDCVKLPQE